MAITIQKTPLNKVGPAGQDWNFVVTSTNVALPKFKYIVDVHIYNFSASNVIDARLKISPAIFGYGNVNIRDILEQHVQTDNLGITGQAAFAPKFKGHAQTWTWNQYDTIPIHLIDQWSLNNYNMVRFDVRFGEMYAPTATDPAVIYPDLIRHSECACWNGTVPNNAQRNSHAYGGTGTFTGGVELQTNLPLYGGPFFPNQPTAHFLSNAPTTQYVRDGDYMTVGTLSGLQNGTNATWDRMRVEIGGQTIDMTDSMYDGSTDSSMTSSYKMLQYFGCGPANLVNNATFNTQWTGGATEYTIGLHNGSGYKSLQYTFKRMEDDCKGYESIRLCWVNRHGTWDYYNFTKKSYRELDIKRENTEQARGSQVLWMQVLPTHRNNNTINVSAKETITVNTDWVDDATSVWLEELFTSPTVYILGSFVSADTGADGPGTEFDYTRGVTLTTNRYERYTKANDKVAQYEIELEVDGYVNVQQNQLSSLNIQ